MKRAIAMLFLLLMLLLVALSSTKKEKEREKEPQEPIETVQILTDKDFEKLYSYKQDIRKHDPKIVELFQSDAWLMMQIARSEGGSTLIGQLWVMRVILNRLENGNFGDSIYEIVSADNQFEVFSNGSYKDAEINANTHLALALIEGGWDETDNALYFESTSNSDESWHKLNRTFVKEVEGNRYYK